MNAERRKYADQIAKEVAKIFSKPAPKCHRISTRRGHGWSRTNEFSVPAWIFERHPVYRDYYIIHETLHCLTGMRDGNPEFHAAEQKILRERNNTRIVYRESGKGRGVYPAKLVEFDTDLPMCDQYGRCVI